MQSSKIQWCTHTFNPWRGCTKVSEGCRNCYAETMSNINHATLGIWGPNGTRVVANPSQWKLVDDWNEWARDGVCPVCAGSRKKVKDCKNCDGTGEVEPYQARVFCASLGDVCERTNITPQWSNGNVFCFSGGSLCNSMTREQAERAGLRIGTLDDVRTLLFEHIDRTPYIDWLLLTKRPENILQVVPRRKSFRSMRILDSATLKELPIEMFEPHEDWAKRLHDGQSLERLNQRGGISVFEAIQILTSDIRMPVDRASFTETAKAGFTVQLQSLASRWGVFRENVWWGTSVESENVLWRIDELCKVPAACRFVSMEPMLEPIDLSSHLGNAGDNQYRCSLCRERASVKTLQEDESGRKTHAFCGGEVCIEQNARHFSPIDWVIVGGESGSEARTFQINWARDIRDQCKAAGVAFFMKQMGDDPTEWHQHLWGGNGGLIPLGLIEDKGGDPSEWPDDLRIREMPFTPVTTQKV